MNSIRSAVYPYMEEIPNPSKTHSVCVSCGDISPEREGQTTIGCIASKYKMYVLGNLIESVPCDSRLDSLCPSDGHYQYNTNIVYDPQGCLIAKYHKYHLFEDEVEMLDTPVEPEYVYFDTDYGRFGTVICADGLYEYPAISLVEKYNIDHLLFPTFWIPNGLAFTTAVEFQLSLATVANVNLIAANVHSTPDFTFGSSILSGSKIVNFTADYKSTDGTLLVGDLPTSRPKSSAQIYLGGDNLPSKSATTATAVIFGDAYNVVVLDNLAGNTQVCQNSLCCTLNYRRNNTDETYILGAFKGVHSFEVKMSLEACLVYKCQTEDLSSCAKPESSSTTKFSTLELSANFTVPHIYPCLSPSDFAYDRLNWSIKHTDVNFSRILTSTSDWPMVNIARVGRDFSHDPPH